MQWDKAADSTCKNEKKEKKKKLTTLGISLLVSLLSTSSWKSLALLPPQGQNSNSLPDVSERSSQRWPFPSDRKAPNHMLMAKNNCPILSPSTLLGAHWSPCNYLHNLSVPWVTAQPTAWQRLFCKASPFPGTHCEIFIHRYGLQCIKA